MATDLCVTLQFRDADEKQWFLGQLSDGFGEDHVLLRYDGDLYTATLVDVEVSQSCTLRRTALSHQRLARNVNAPYTA